MEPTLALSADTRSTAGVILLTIVFIEYGGMFVLRLSRGGAPSTELQRTFSRAGHGHAGVLVTLALVGLLLADGAALDGLLAVGARNGIWLGAVLMPAGFFLSVTGRDVSEPNRLIWLLYAGAASVAVGVVSLGIGLLST